MFFFACLILHVCKHLNISILSALNNCNGNKYMIYIFIFLGKKLFNGEVLSIKIVLGKIMENPPLKVRDSRKIMISGEKETFHTENLSVAAGGKL